MLVFFTYIRFNYHIFNLSSVTCTTVFQPFTKLKGMEICSKMHTNAFNKNLWVKISTLRKGIKNQVGALY